MSEFGLASPTFACRGLGITDDEVNLSAEEIERRAGEIAHRLPNTPPKSQSQIKGKSKAKKPDREPILWLDQQPDHCWPPNWTAYDHIQAKA